MAPLLLALVATLPTIWIVDASNGPGTNFTDLPAAVAAAVSGDTILVRPGFYTCFAVSGKDLTIRGSGAATTIVKWAPSSPPFVPTIDNVPAGATFYIDGLTFSPPAFFVFQLSTVVGLNIFGPTTRVALADIVVNGTNMPPSSGPFLMNSGTAGLYVTGGAEVHASRCTFAGGSGNYGGPGAYVSAGCRLAAEASTFSGGAVPFLGQGYGGAGLVTSGLVTASGSSFFGGAGFTNSGGNAISAAGTSAFVRLAFTLADTIGGGTNPFGSPPGYALVTSQGASAHVHGVPTVVGSILWSGSVTTGPPLPDLSIAGTAAGGGELLASQPVTVTMNGLVPFAPYTFAVDFGPAFSTAYAPLLLGELLVPVPPAGILQGTLDASGIMQTTLTPSVAVPSLVNIPLYAQFGILDSVTGQVRLSNGPVWFFKQ